MKNGTIRKTHMRFTLPDGMFPEDDPKALLVATSKGRDGSSALMYNYCNEFYIVKMNRDNQGDNCIDLIGDCSSKKVRKTASGLGFKKWQIVSQEEQSIT